MTNSELRTELDNAANNICAVKSMIAKAHTEFSGYRAKFAENRVTPAWRWELLLHKLDKCFTELDEVQEDFEDALDDVTRKINEDDAE